MTEIFRIFFDRRRRDSLANRFSSLRGARLQSTYVIVINVIASQCRAALVSIIRFFERLSVKLSASAYE